MLKGLCQERYSFDKAPLLKDSYLVIKVIRLPLLLQQPHF